MERSFHLKKKLLFLDIDGTILKEDHTYTELTKTAILQANKNDIEVFLSTGRPIHEVDYLAKELHIQSFIGYNGAVSEYQNKRIVHNTIPVRAIQEILYTAQHNNHEVMLFTRDRNYLTSLKNPSVNSFIETLNFRNNTQLIPEVLNDILSITLVNVDEDQLNLYQEITDIHITQVNIEGFYHCYDVTKKNVNKGNAIKKTLEYLNVSKEDTIAFGDGLNDIEMLQAVGESFAMENGNPEIFKHAKYIAKSASESGIYYGLKQLKLID
jgi:Cof subfamily protein (haloacid dehalogenase superfamily)